MLIKIQSLLELRIECVDRPVGTVSDFLFDQRKWALRYAIASLDMHGFHRTAAVPMTSVTDVDLAEKRIRLSLDSAQVFDSPDYNHGRPMTRQIELDLQRHYDLQPAPLSDIAPVPPGTSAPPVSALGGVGEVREQIRRPSGLQSAREIMGGTLQAAEGVVGTTEDLLVDRSSWEIRYLVANPGQWLEQERLVVIPTIVQRSEWSENSITLDVSRRQIAQSPAWEGGEVAGAEFERDLEKHYGIAPH